MGAIRDLHVRVNQGLQRVDSHRENDFLPEEIDMALYKNALRLIKEKYAPISNKRLEGFEDSRKRLQDLKYESRYRKPLEIFKHPDIENLSMANLPSDFLYFESVVFDVVYHQNLLKLDKKEEIVNTFVAVFKLPSTGYDAFNEFNISGVLPDVSQQFKDDLENYTIPTDLEIFVDKFIDWYNENTDYNVYWQSYNDLFYPSSFIFIPKEGTDTTGITDTNSTITYSNLGSVAETDTFTEKTFLKQSAEGREDRGVGKFLRLSHDGTNTQDSFYRTTYKEPLIVFEQDTLYIHEGETFHIKGGNISYVSRPEPFSYNLDIGSPYSYDIDQEIVDMTVLDLLEMSGSERFQSNMIQEQRKE